MIVAEESYEVTEPTVDSHLVKLKASGADILISATIPKFAAQAIRKAGELGWKPLHLMSSVVASIRAVLKPAGLEHAKDVISSAYMMDPADPKWMDHPSMKEYRSLASIYMSELDPEDRNVVDGWNRAQVLVKVLEMCGDDLSRENIMKQAASLKHVRTSLLLQGITINTSPEDYQPLKQLQLMKFDGEKWELFGPVMSSEQTE
jgi:branched-chain amino acid transport system substrate-binding protein